MNEDTFLLQQMDAPFTGHYLTLATAGRYHCQACRNPVFDAADKYDSGSGWPSFSRALEDAVHCHLRGSRLGKVTCAHCRGFLGIHTRADSFGESGERFDINSSKVIFLPH